MISLLSWRAGNGGCAVTVVASRAAVHGLPVLETDDGFLVPSGTCDRAVAALGVAPTTDADHVGGRAVHPPRIALFAGESAGYPYYAY